MADFSATKGEINSVHVVLTGHCESGQAYDYGTGSFPRYLRGLYAPPHRHLYALTSPRWHLLLDGNIRCGSGF